MVVSSQKFYNILTHSNCDLKRSNVVCNLKHHLQRDAVMNIQLFHTVHIKQIPNLDVQLFLIYAPVTQRTAFHKWSTKGLHKHGLYTSLQRHALTPLQFHK